MPTSWLGGGCRSLSQGRLWGFLGSRSAVSSSTATSPVHLSRSLQHKQAWRSLSANARGQQSIVADHGDEKKAEKLASMLLDQNRFALSRAITLVESTKFVHMLSFLLMNPNRKNCVSIAEKNTDALLTKCWPTCFSGLAKM